MRTLVQTVALALQVLGILLLLSPSLTCEILQLEWETAPIPGRIAGFLVLIAGFSVFSELSRRAEEPSQPTLDIQNLLESLQSTGARERAGQLLTEGRKIDAIKEVRAALGCGLKDAKDLVETLAAQERPAGPLGD